ncbi:sodium/glutamate symporter [Phytoactinopolyspora mesophila]|uniref:Sodium:glutamate symporter n=1 Tax=Phytoactinopolyspora mesophila TaxID=2650750 RepID=A0A7K3M7U6_9ACTN|nr:sodium/glutamate symporter [Phytoactinopolyspora mesophila]NDL59391.1 sodium:glutamate symporter [Phytoactinopolyspora mesophila]
MSADVVGMALLLLGLVLVVAKLVRLRSRWCQRLFLPSSIIGGFLALLLGPEILGRIAGAFGYDGWGDGGMFGSQILEVWSTLPGLLISVVFATLFLGERIPNPKDAAKLVGPQMSFGVALGAGQYVIGLLLAILLLAPLFDIDPMAGALIEISFEGGHGTAAGMRDAMAANGFPEGADLALGLATVGVVSGIVIGVGVINWAVRRGHTVFLKGDAQTSVEEQRGLYLKDEQHPAATMTVRPSSVEPLAIHFSIVAVAILIGHVMLSALRGIEEALWKDDVELFAHVPLFPLAMLGGVVVQLAIDRLDRTGIVDRLMMLRIQGLALDLLIISALATLSIQAIADQLGPFLLLAGVGIAWNVLALVYIARRIIPRYWFERGIGDFGQSMGVTATGLILMRVADPEAKSPAFEAFGYKQLLFEPFFGGGLITAASIPLISQFGPEPFLLAMAALLVFALATGLLYFGKQRAEPSGKP